MEEVCSSIDLGVCSLGLSLNAMRAWLLTTAAAAVAAVAQALRIALLQPAVAADPYVLSAAAATCKDWQHAVQLGSLDVKVTVQPSLSQLHRLASWLPKHAGSVRSLRINFDKHGYSQSEVQRAEELLLQALQQAHAAGPAATAKATHHPSALTTPELAAAAAGAEAAAAEEAEAAAADASTNTSAAAAAAATTVAAPSAAAAGGLQLQSFGSNCITTAGARVLQLLPAHTLTRLELQIPLQQPHDNQASSEPVGSQALSAAVAQLSNLQHLRLAVQTSEDAAAASDGALLDDAFGDPASGLEPLESSIAEACLAGIAQLSCLTSLELDVKASDTCEVGSGSQHIIQQAVAPQLQLRRLQLRVRHWEHNRFDASAPVLDLAHLNQLTEFTLNSCLPDGTVLPQQLQHLHLEESQLELQLLYWDDFQRMKPILTPRAIYYLAALKQLQHLHVGHCNSSDLSSLTALSSLQEFSFEVRDSNPDALLRLAQLPLKHLGLRYDGEFDAAAANAPAWSQLPQLRELQFNVIEVDTQPTDLQLLSIMPGLTACSGLTKLSLNGIYAEVVGYWHPDPDARDSNVAVCSTLAGLTTLKDLEIRFVDAGDYVPGDAMALTALTGLTRLVLDGRCLTCYVVDDLAATALAWNLRQLRHLNLLCCKLGSMACLVMIGQTLTQLTELQLGGNKGITQRGLMQLTKLQKLRRLGVDRNVEVTDAVLRQFWAAVPVIL
jgi:hypothetical protein